MSCFKWGDNVTQSFWVLAEHKLWGYSIGDKSDEIKTPKSRRVYYTTGKMLPLIHMVSSFRKNIGFAFVVTVHSGSLAQKKPLNGVVW